MFHVVSKKGPNLKNLPRSHLVFSKVLLNRKQAKSLAYGWPHPVCFRKLLLPQGSKKGCTQGITLPPFKKRPTQTSVTCSVQKRAQSKNLPRSHLVFPKALWNRKQAKPSAYGQPHPVCFRKLLLPPGSKPLPSLFGILVAVSTSSLESCLGESPLALVIATSPEKKSKNIPKPP